VKSTLFLRSAKKASK